MALIGARRFPSSPSVPSEILDAFRTVEVSIASDVMNRLHGTRALRPFHGGARLVGTAVTVRTRPGDNLTLHQAYDLLRPGDVLVVDGAGDLAQALVGEIMVSRAKAMGVAGFVIDGAVRDVEALLRLGLPVYARGVTPRGPTKYGPGELNVPVAVDGMVVMPGDAILGDADGVVSFDRNDAVDLLAAIRVAEARESAVLAAIAEGRVDTGYAAPDPLPGSRPSPG